MLKIISLSLVLATLSLTVGLAQNALSEENYEYDMAGRLIKVVYGNEDQIEYTYDRSGNVIEYQVQSQVTSTHDLHLSEIILNQNEPNPCTQATQFSYLLPTSMKIDLEIYDVLGRYVATLDEGFRSAGKHEVSWDCLKIKAFNGGTYFYRLKTNKGTLSRKMITLN